MWRLVGLVDLTLLLQLAALLVLVALSGFFSGSEVALVSANRIRLLHLAEEGNKRAVIVSRLLEDPDRLLASILVGNNLVNIGASALATALAIQVFGSLGVGIATGVMTLLILVFGEITPKSLANRYSEEYAMAVARPIELLTILLGPVVVALTAMARLAIRLTGGDVEQEIFVSEEEIKMLLDVGEEQGIIEEEEREMIHNIFEFGDLTAVNVMTPRVEVHGVSADAHVEDALEIINETGHSRLPVYEESLDNIIGLIYAKDILKHMGENLRIRDIMRLAYYVPESKNVDELLRELRDRKIHIAIVIDEYGGTAGVVTLEDILEEIVGDIWDEFDLDENLYEQIDEDTAIVNALMHVEEVNQLLEVDLPSSEFETIGGLAFNLLGRQPRKGDRVETEDTEMTILRTDGRRIYNIRLHRKPPTDTIEEPVEDTEETTAVEPETP